MELKQGRENTGVPSPTNRKQKVTGDLDKGVSLRLSDVPQINSK